MAVKNKILTIPLGSFASNSMSGTYQPVFSGNGIPNACFSLRVINNSTQDVTISFDGTNDSDYVIKATSQNIPAIYALLPNTLSAQFAQGTQVYVKGTAGTGTIYISGYYQPQT